MEIEIKDGKITIDPIELLESLTGEQKFVLIEALSCQDEVIKNVSDQIIHGCTERGWHGGKGTSENISTPLDKAIRDVSENSSEIAKKEIDRLKRIIKSARELGHRGWDRYHKAMEMR